MTSIWRKRAGFNKVKKCIISLLKYFSSFYILGYSLTTLTKDRIAISFEIDNPILYSSNRPFCLCLISLNNNSTIQLTYIASQIYKKSCQ